MSKLILFSQPSEDLLNSIASDIFVRGVMNVAYLPANGDIGGNKYLLTWKDYVTSYGATFVTVTNLARGDQVSVEKEKIMKSDALILTGGNTFEFLNNLKESKLDSTIVEYLKLDKIVIAFSAGAIILSENINIANCGEVDENRIGLSDLSGLNLIDFDIYPHYEESLHKEVVDDYIRQTGKDVKRLTNDDYIVVNI